MSFRLDMHQTVQDIITKKQRLQFETQRLEALASGHFFKAILPIMCDNGVITERRFMDLVLGVDTSIESKVATKELLQLAVLWGVTRSPSEFWQTHRSRAELIEGLQRAKSSIDSDAKRQQEVQERQIDAATVAQDMSEDTRLRQRRASLVHLKVLAGQATYAGDLFSSRGAYDGGARYLSRHGKAAPAAVSSDPGAALRGWALRRRGAVGPGATSTTSEEDDLDEIAAIAAFQLGATDQEPDAPVSGELAMPPESTAGIQQSQMRLARTSSEVELPPPSARAEWVASLQRRLSPGQSPRSSSSSSSAPLSDGVEGGAGSRPAPMTVESFVSKYGGGGGEAVDAAAEREGSGAGPAAATATAGADTSLPLAAATAVVAAADGTSGGGGGIDSAATAAAFRRYIHMMAQLPSAAPGSTGAGSTGAVRVRAAPRSLWAGTGLWVADSSADTPPSRAGAAAPSRKQHSGPTAAPGSAPAPSSAVAAPPFGLRALPKQQLYYRPLTDAATVTLVLEREPVAAGSGRRTADALPQQLLPQQPRRQIANSAGPVPGTTPRDSESAHEAATAAGMAAAAAPPSRQPPRTLPSRMRSRWDVSGEPLRPPPAAAPVSCWERLSSSTGRGGACKSADAAIRPGRSGALAKQPPAVSNAVMQEIRTLERTLLGRPLGSRWQQLGGDHESAGAGSVSTATEAREQ